MSKLMDKVFGKDDVADLKTSIAFDGESRSNGEVHNITLHVSLEGVSVRDIAEKALSQKAVEFQRPRRSAEKGGSMESKEAFDELCEQYGDELNIHFSQIGKAPDQVKSAEQIREEQLQQAEAMSEDDLDAYIQRLEELRAQKAG
jgi:hypothetical protein